VLDVVLGPVAVDGAQVAAGVDGELAAFLQRGLVQVLQRLAGAVTFDGGRSRDGLRVDRPDRGEGTAAAADSSASGA